MIVLAVAFSIPKPKNTRNIIRKIFRKGPQNNLTITILEIINIARKFKKKS